jgi:hypothetical protein
MDLLLSYHVHTQNCHVLYDGSSWTLQMDKARKVIVFGQEAAARIVSWLRRLDDMLNWQSNSSRGENPASLPECYVRGGDYDIKGQGWVKCAIVRDDGEDEFCVQISSEFGDSVKFDMGESWVLIAVFEAEILHHTKGYLAMKTWRD